MLEVGRFCVDPDRFDPDILRLAWAAVTRLVDQQGIGMLFGCSSFSGNDPMRFEASFQLLAQCYLQAEPDMVGLRAVDSFRLSAGQTGVDLKVALSKMPPMLRSYLALGGRVSDHAVIDRSMQTMHVFTTLKIADIPPGRAKLLRQVSL